MTKIFVGGVYRSGTTLLTRIIDNHSKLWCTFDSVHFLRFSYEKFNPITDRNNQVSLVSEISERLKRRWDIDFPINQVIASLQDSPVSSYGEIYDRVLSALALQENPQAIGWGEKTVLCWHQMKDFLKMFPDGKVLHIVRDPRDVLLSFKKLTSDDFPGYLNTAFVCLDSFHFSQWALKNLDASNFFLLRYEDLISNPNKAVEKICSFLEVPYEESMLNVEIFKDKNGGNWDGDSAFQKEFTQFSRFPIGRYKQFLLPEEIAFIESVNKESMQVFGYSLDAIEVNKLQESTINEWLEMKGLKEKFANFQETGRGVQAFRETDLSECLSMSVYKLDSPIEFGF